MIAAQVYAILAQEQNIAVAALCDQVHNLALEEQIVIQFQDSIILHASKFLQIFLYSNLCSNFSFLSLDQ